MLLNAPCRRSTPSPSLLPPPPLLPPQLLRLSPSPPPADTPTSLHQHPAAIPQAPVAHAPGCALTWPKSAVRPVGQTPPHCQLRSIAPGKRWPEAGHQGTFTRILLSRVSRLHRSTWCPFHTPYQGAALTQFSGGAGLVPSTAYPIQGEAAAARKAAVFWRIGSLSSVREMMGPRPKLTNSVPHNGLKSNSQIHRRCTTPCGSSLETAPATSPPQIDVSSVKLYCAARSQRVLSQPTPKPHHSALRTHPAQTRDALYRICMHEALIPALTWSSGTPGITEQPLGCPRQNSKASMLLATACCSPCFHSWELQH